MTLARFVVCEESNRWTVAVRWLWSGNPRRLVVAQDLDDGWRTLVRSPASFLALELNESNLEAVVRRLQDMRSGFPQARAAVMCDSSLASCQWLVREAGASHVATSLRDMSCVLRLANRHFALVPQPEVGIRQNVWDRLAWQDP